MAESAFALFGLLGKNVPHECVLTLDFTGTGKLKTLLGAGFGLRFWHRYSDLNYLLFLRVDQHKHFLSLELWHRFRNSVFRKFLNELKQ